MAAQTELFEMGSKMPEEADHFFRYHDAERTEVASSGDVESPVGHFTLRQVETGDIRDHVSATGDSWAASHLEPGWYLDIRDSNGIIHAYLYGAPDYTLPEEYARADFEKLMNEYDKWDSQDEADEPHEHDWSDPDQTDTQGNHIPRYCEVCGLTMGADDSSIEQHQVPGLQLDMRVLVTMTGRGTYHEIWLEENEVQPFKDYLANNVMSVLRGGPTDEKGN